MGPESFNKSNGKIRGLCNMVGLVPFLSFSLFLDGSWCLWDRWNFQDGLGVPCGTFFWETEKNISKVQVWIVNLRNKNFLGEYVMMKIFSLKPMLASLPSAILASLCCVLPLAVVVLGIGSGAFMMYTMKYSYIYIPIGVIGVGLGYFFYFREKKKCDALSCRMAAGKFNLVVLIFATVLVVTAIVFTVFPEFIAPLLMGSS